MAIIGMHALMYSKKAQATREFFRDVLRFPAVSLHAIDPPSFRRADPCADVR
jgi:hypothetical protein